MDAFSENMSENSRHKKAGHPWRMARYQTVNQIIGLTPSLRCDRVLEFCEVDKVNVVVGIAVEHIQAR